MVEGGGGVAEGGERREGRRTAAANRRAPTCQAATCILSWLRARISTFSMEREKERKDRSKKPANDGKTCVSY